MGSMAQTGLLLVPSDALGHTWALPGALGGGQGLPPKPARRTLINNELIIIGRRRGAAAGGAERGGETICTERASWPLSQRNGRAALDSRGCLPPVAAQAGGGGKISCSAEREQAPPCPVCDAGRWSCHRRFVHNHHAATVAGARHVPVGRTVLVESVCRQGGTHSGTVPTGRGWKGVAPQRGWHSSQRPHLRKVGHGSTRNFLANTRAPPSLRRARCGRTSITSS